MQQHGKGKGKASELPVCNQCAERGLKCKLGPGKSTLCTECIQFIYRDRVRIVLKYGQRQRRRRSKARAVSAVEQKK